jgi:perosamine synthetase
MQKIPIMVPWLDETEIEAVSEVIRSGWIAQGPAVKRFEHAFSTQLGSVEAVAVANCTVGLQLALIVAGIQPGDEVIVPSFSFIATTNSVIHVGAVPVFADIAIETGNLTAASIARVVTNKTRAVMIVHQAGVPADLEEIFAFCSPRGLIVVEDAACAIGSTYKSRLIGSHSDLVVFSFHPRKILTTGEGGMIATSNSDWAARLRRLREHGMSISATDRHATGGVSIEQYAEPGFNFRMTDIQAAIGLVQLSKLSTQIRHRRELAARYEKHLAEIDGLRPVVDPPYGECNFQSYWVELDDSILKSRNKVMEDLDSRGISTRRGIMTAHREPACAKYFREPLPNSERLSDNSLIIPLYHTMSQAEQDHVIESIIKVIQ